MADKRRLEPSDTDDGTDGAIVEVKKARTGDALALTASPQARKSAAVPSVSSLAPNETRPKPSHVQ
jgi:hypothetical protein